MKILVNYYIEKEIEVDDEFLPLEVKDSYDDADCELLHKLVNQVSTGLDDPSELAWICDANGHVIFEQ